ncbi:MAG TPA: GntR family transcriptional regulator [Mycobacterium sp.]|nr:GntR family transcriptional regulator [Mycobacterium sp.]
MAEASDQESLVNVAAGVPLHRQLFLVLHDEIARGALAAGDGLPTELSMCEQFGVSRITVRRALADLAEAGLIERRHGVGSFVTDRSPPRGYDETGSYMDELRQVEFETEVEVIEFGVRTVPGPIAERLGGPDQALHVLRLRRERRTGERLMISEAWLPEGLADELTAPGLAGAPIFHVLHDAGVGLTSLDHELTAEIAGPRTAATLGVSIGAALIRVNSLAHTAAGPHHCLSVTLSPNRSRVLLTQTAADLESGVGMAIAHDVRRPLA